MRAYIDFEGGICRGRHELTDSELREIGEFTRENVLAWMESRTSPDWVGVLHVQDFHAFCGHIDIPWATEEAKLCWDRVMSLPN